MKRKINKTQHEALSEELQKLYKAKGEDYVLNIPDSPETLTALKVAKKARDVAVAIVARFLPDSVADGLLSDDVDDAVDTALANLEAIEDLDIDDFDANEFADFLKGDGKKESKTDADVKALTDQARQDRAAYNKLERTLKSMEKERDTAVQSGADWKDKFEGDNTKRAASDFVLSLKLGDKLQEKMVRLLIESEGLRMDGDDVVVGPEDDSELFSDWSERWKTSDEGQEIVKAGFGDSNEDPKKTIKEKKSSNEKTKSRTEQAARALKPLNLDNK